MPEVSQSVGRYLCAIRLLSMNGDGRAKTSELADRLSVSNASVTEMLSTLEGRGLATYEKYQGVKLTSRGETTARELLWKRCVAENFLDEEADPVDPAIAAGVTDGVSASEASRGSSDQRSEGGETRAFGHALSDEVASRLRAYIDHPCEGQCGAPDAEYAECCEDFQTHH